MKNGNKKHVILVISGTPRLAQITREAVNGKAETIYASDEAMGILKTREIHPDIVLLGRLENPESTTGLFNRLREGWISRHSFLLLVDWQDSQVRILGQEDIRKLIGNYSLSAGNESRWFPESELSRRLQEVISQKLEQRENKLKASILDPNCFCLTWEQIPGLGAFEIRQELVLENARKAAAGGQVCAISIVDNPGGNPAIATEILCSEIRKLGIEPMVHLAFRDRSRNQVESLLYQLAALDINNLLILTGDYPAGTSFQGTSRPVFDLDSVQGLQLIAEMNRGMEHEIMRRSTRLAPTEFFAGVAVSPFKRDRSEALGQYYKLKKKIEAGADFAITQIGYDARKLHELLVWLETHELKLPVLTSIQVLSLATAKAMHQNRVPGAVVTDKLLAQIEQESRSPDKGRAARLERAARMYAISAGMGFKGACLSGQSLVYSDVEYIIQRGQELQKNWMDLLPEFDFPQERGFYYFHKQESSLLNSRVPVIRRERPARPLIYYVSYLLHLALFEPRTPGFKIMRGIVPFIDRSRVLKKAFHALEFWTKAVLYGCKDCGDCALFDAAYICPVSQCPKNQRNGPCGGSFESWCEVYPDEKLCIWVRAYSRNSNKENFTGDYIVPPCDWGLWQTSSWLNYFLGKDHVSKRLGIRPISSRK